MSFVLGLVLMPGLCQGVDYFALNPIDCGNSNWSEPSQAYLAYKATGLKNLEVGETYFVTMWYFDNIMDGYVIYM
jgi:hypothetical protein